jgi:hypothetical protein
VYNDSPTAYTVFASCPLDLIGFSFFNFFTTVVLRELL